MANILDPFHTKGVFNLQMMEHSYLHLTRRLSRDKSSSLRNLDL